MMQTLNNVIDNAIKAYVLNALWQTPLLWLAAEIVTRWMKPSRAAVAHRVWAICLLLAVALPAAPLLRHAATAQHVAAIQVPQRLIVSQATVARAALQTMRTPAMQAELPDAPQTSFGEAESDRPAARAQTVRNLPWKLIGIRLLCGAYFFSVLFAIAKLSWGLWRTARLLRSAKPTLLPPDLQRVWNQCCARSRVEDVRLFNSHQVTSPSTLTFRSAVILLPSAMPECGESEMAAALCHELAHVRRRDFLKNLVYEFAIAPLFFHPVTHAMARRVQETRELACDDMAAEMLDGRAAYASSLLRLAETMSASVAQAGRALGVFEGNVLEKRVMNLIETKVKRSGWRAVLPAVCGVLMLAVSCVASLKYGLRPVLAHARPNASISAEKSVTPVTAEVADAPAVKAADAASPTAPLSAEPAIPAAADASVGEADMVPAVVAGFSAPEPAATAEALGLQSTVTYHGTPPVYANPGDLKPVAFKVGRTYFQPGDNISIDEIRGSSDKIEEGNIYQIKGHYTLVSHDGAQLNASVTTSRENARPGASPSRNMTVNKGTGEFAVWLWLGEHGDPHISFYPAGGGSSFAGVYFESASSNTSVAPAVAAPTPGQTREAPKGWSLQGNDPTNYLTGVDKNVTREGQSSAYLLALADNGDKFGTLSQWFKGKEYLGKRVRFRAWVRSKDVSNWAGLWMRVDEEDGKKSVAFDNMQKRAIKGTSDWQLYDVVLDVPKKASDIDLGILLTGPGEVWMSGVQVEVVGPEVALTDMMEHNGMPDGPTNLDFGK